MEENGRNLDCDVFIISKGILYCSPLPATTIITVRRGVVPVLKYILAESETGKQLSIAASDGNDSMHEPLHETRTLTFRASSLSATFPVIFIVICLQINLFLLNILDFLIIEGVRSVTYFNITTAWDKASDTSE